MQVYQKRDSEKNPSKKNYDENAYSNQTLSTKNSGATTKDDLEEYMCLATKKVHIFGLQTLCNALPH